MSPSSNGNNRCSDGLFNLRTRDPTFNPMKVSKTLKFLLTLISAVVLSFCSNDEDLKQKSVGQVDKTQLQNAMDWYSSASNIFTAARDRETKVKPHWDHAKAKQLDKKRSALLVPTDQYELENSTMGFFRGFIFILEEGQVIEGSLVEFYALRQYVESNASELLVRYVGLALKDFSGSIISYDVNYRNSGGYRYSNGSKTKDKVGVVNSEIVANKGGRTKTCWDVYLITFYSDGSEEYSYLYNYCESEQSGYEPGAGGSSSGSTTTIDGNTKIITEPNGQITIKQWKCLGYQQCGWLTVSIIIPTAAIVAEPPRYSFLPSNPSNGLIVFSELVNFAYQYDGNENKWIGTPAFVVPGLDPAKKITNMAQYLDCFNEWYDARITIYVDQPIKGSDQCSTTILSPAFDIDVGHTFIGIQQNDNIKILGFYPEYKATPGNPLMPGTAAMDQGHDYDVSVSFDVSGQELMGLVTFLLQNSNNVYDLNHNNCSNFAIVACMEAGVMLPDAPSTWVMGPSAGDPGVCPGKLGEVLRSFSLPSRASSVDIPPFGGTAPNDYRQCNNDHEEN
jgi:hypothetical protein